MQVLLTTSGVRAAGGYSRNLRLSVRPAHLPAAGTHGRMRQATSDKCEKPMPTCGWRPTAAAEIACAAGLSGRMLVGPASARAAGECVCRRPVDTQSSRSGTDVQNTDQDVEKVILLFIQR